MRSSNQQHRPRVCRQIHGSDRAVRRTADSWSVRRCCLSISAQAPTTNGVRVLGRRPDRPAASPDDRRSSRRWCCILSPEQRAGCAVGNRLLQPPRRPTRFRAPSLAVGAGLTRDRHRAGDYRLRAACRGQAGAGLPTLANCLPMAGVPGCRTLPWACRGGCRTLPSWSPSLANRVAGALPQSACRSAGNELCDNNQVRSEVIHG